QETSKPNAASEGLRLGDADAAQLAAQERVFHQPAAAVEVLFHAGAGAGGVVTRDRVRDLHVRFGRRLGELAEVHPERHKAIYLREAALDQLERGSIP